MWEVGKNQLADGLYTHLTCPSLVSGGEDNGERVLICERQCSLSPSRNSLLRTIYYGHIWAYSLGRRLAVFWCDAVWEQEQASHFTQYLSHAMYMFLSLLKHVGLLHKWCNRMKRRAVGLSRDGEESLWANVPYLGSSTLIANQPVVRSWRLFCCCSQLRISAP